jgi:Zn-dependent peptidase ImmA (M78 family)
MKRGFKTQAQQIALEVRDELGLGADDPLDPWVLAELYGIPVYGLTELKSWENIISHFNRRRQDAFSAALIPLEHARIIVENIAHALVRRRANVTHEMAHVILEHDFQNALLFADGCRLLDPDVEEEATWFAGELLIPTAAALTAARAGSSDGQVAASFGVSRSLAAMRMNGSGARRRAEREAAARSRGA